MSIACKVRPIGGEALLPDGYQRCEYLESTGTQYIDTGIQVSENLQMNCEILVPHFGKQNMWLYGAGFKVFAFLAYFSRDYYAYSYYNQDALRLEQLNENEKYSIEQTKEYIKISNKKYLFPIEREGVITSEMRLFGIKNPADNEVNFSGRIYFAKISESTEIVRNFIPCLDNKGKPCMFDTVSRTSYYNKGTGDFLYKLKTPLIRKLPRGYQPLDYLESNGTQYIRTGIEAAADIGTYAIFTQEDGTSFNHVLSAVNFYTPHVNNNVDVVAGRYGNNGSLQQVSFPFPGIGIKITASTNWLNSKKICVDDECIDVSDAYTGEISGELTLFNYSSPTANFGLRGRIYSAKISGGVEIIRDFVPCLDPTGKPCMWDYVTRRPFYNQNTTGPDFLYG